MSYPPEHPLSQLDTQANAALEAAYDSMRRSYCGRISTLHLLLGLLADESNEANQFLRLCGVDVSQLKAEASAKLTSDGELATPEKRFNPAAKRALERAKTEAQRCAKAQISTAHLLAALLPRSANARENVEFGTKLDDEVGPLLANINPAQLVAFMRTGQIKTYQPPSLIPLLGATFISAFSLWGLKAAHSPSDHRTFIEWGFIWLYLLDFGGCVFMIAWAARRLKNPTMASSWLFGLCGAFLGSMIGAVVADLATHH